MVIVRLIGGLGNQLFQYAAGSMIAHKNDVPLRIDITPFNKYTLHKFCLGSFNISADIATKDEIMSVTNLWQRVPSIFKPYYLRSMVKEQFFHFDPNMLNVPSEVYLNGFWQSEKYFKEIEELIRYELTIKFEPNAENIKVANDIANSNAISLHVRRGDYVSNSKTNQIHGICSLTYFRKATEIIARHISDPHFFIFSDDPVWVQNNLKIEYATTYVTNNNADKNYEDLRLMSLCQHHIIANSSFSWWGAWLNPKPDKVVIAPKNWFGTQQKNTVDLVPNSWIRL